MGRHIRLEEGNDSIDSTHPLASTFMDWQQSGALFDLFGFFGFVTDAGCFGA